MVKGTRSLSAFALKIMNCPGCAFWQSTGPKSPYGIRLGSEILFLRFDTYFIPRFRRYLVGRYDLRFLCMLKTRCPSLFRLRPLLKTAFHSFGFENRKKTEEPQSYSIYYSISKGKRKMQIPHTSYILSYIQKVILSYRPFKQKRKIYAICFTAALLYVIIV